MSYYEDVRANDGVVYHCTCTAWDGGDLLPLVEMFPDWEEREQFIKDRWPDVDPEGYDSYDAQEVHCNWTRHDAERFQDAYCPSGDILAIYWDQCGLRIRQGIEYNHPVFVGRVPYTCIRRVQR